MIRTVEVFTGQTPFETNHCKAFVPETKPVNVLVASAEFVITAVPLITDHTPTLVPDGVFAASMVVGELIQSDWFGPATGLSARSSTRMVTLEELEQAPLVSVHCSVLRPKPKFVKVADAEVLLVNTPEPDDTDQLPAPAVGVLPLNTMLGELMHKVWLLPAAATPGVRSTCMITDDEFGAQTPLDTDH